jgi:AbrB family looped-hinge helix DNA binding protein
MASATSKITSKFQTTIPKAVRENLKLSVSDTLDWQIKEGKIVVKAQKRLFLKHKNSIKTGIGDIEEDRDAALNSRLEKYR